MVKYKRIILKISGEALAGEAGFGIKPPVIAKIAQQIKEVHELGVQTVSYTHLRAHETVLDLVCRLLLEKKKKKKKKKTKHKEYHIHINTKTNKE
ncbi:Uridylate kinase [Lactobacillus casei W56] [Lacticaseibacillus rhamnosus]|nr:Uridylate kinase [Lactobacillus casei W56] [Lacticaseibacillus rhamnosus]